MILNLIISNNMNLLNISQDLTHIMVLGPVVAKIFQDNIEVDFLLQNQKTIYILDSDQKMYQPLLIGYDKILTTINMHEFAKLCINSTKIITW